MRYLLALLLSVGQVAQAQTYYQPPLFIDPAHPGHFSSTPPVAAPSGELPITVDPTPVPSGELPDGVTAAPPPVSSTPSAQAPPVNYRSGMHQELMGTKMKADLQGTTRLVNRIREEKVMKAYMAWLDGANVKVHAYVDQLPRTSADLQKLGIPVAPAAPDSFEASDGAQQLAAAGEALVIPEFADMNKMMEVMRNLGIGVKVDSEDHQWTTWDVLEATRQIEEAKYARDAELNRQETLAIQARATAGLAVFGNAHDLAEPVAEAEEAPAAAAQSPAPPALPPEFLAQVDVVQAKVDKIQAFAPQPSAYKNIAQTSLLDAKESFIGGFSEDAQVYLRYAEAVADLALGIDPFTGFARSLVESITGHNAITFEELSPTERGFAIFGVLTAGGFASYSTLLRAASRLGADVSRAERILAAAERFGQSIPKILEGIINVLSNLRKDGQLNNGVDHLLEIERSILREGSFLNNLEILSSEEVNNLDLDSYVKRLSGEGAKIPFKPTVQIGTHAIQGELKTSEVFLRFSYLDHASDTAGQSGPVGSYLVSMKDASELLRQSTSSNALAGLVQQKLSLPARPNYVTEVYVPAGTKILTSRIAAHWDGDAGALQYVLREFIPITNFKNTRSLGEWINGK